ncbi:MAG: hypothetical protein K1X31_11945 [Gemmatimonadaceae bacterium]|nr:hypothetical protein [Gemmatimonadaceae bacterium]
MRLRLPILFAAAVLSGACLDPLPTPDGRFGTINATAISDGGAGYVMKPEAAFYDNTDLSFSTFPSDTCFVAAYVPNATVNGALQTLNAGDYLFTSVSGRVDSLVPAPGISLRVYGPLRTNGIPFIPGDSLTITVPGATRGFPASAVTVRTAEPFTHGAIGVPADGVGLDLTWTTPPTAGSRMTFSLRYANIFATGVENEQVYCSFIDDGSASIPTAYLNGWRTSVGGLRSTRAVRVRWSEVVIDTRTRLSVVSSFPQPITSLVQ